ncbi:MAG: hypothetical protein LBH54_02500 [Clostridiales bacterium]|jgi:hypothetical protein|nr:hypothetical protein [Clostridiales bacterium]
MCKNRGKAICVSAVILILALVLPLGAVSAYEVTSTAIDGGLGRFSPRVADSFKIQGDNNSISYCTETIDDGGAPADHSGNTVLRWDTGGAAGYLDYKGANGEDGYAEDFTLQFDARGNGGLQVYFRDKYQISFTVSDQSIRIKYLTDIFRTINNDGGEKGTILTGAAKTGAGQSVVTDPSGIDFENAWMYTFRLTVDDSLIQIECLKKDSAPIHVVSIDVTDPAMLSDLRKPGKLYFETGAVYCLDNISLTVPDVFRAANGTVIAAPVKGDTLTVPIDVRYVEGAEASKTVWIGAAMYDSTQDYLLDFQPLGTVTLGIGDRFTDATLRFTPTVDNAKIKLFIWDGLDGIEPLAPCAESAE